MDSRSLFSPSCLFLEVLLELYDRLGRHISFHQEYGNHECAELVACDPPLGFVGE